MQCRKRFGGEGLILKDRYSVYERKRSKVWLKIKRFDEEVGFINALYKMGSKSIEGMAGSVIVNYADGTQLAICGALSHEHRKAMVGPDGNIAPEYIGRKVLVRWHSSLVKSNEEKN